MRRFLPIAGFLMVGAFVLAQNPGAKNAMVPKAPRAAYFVDTKVIDLLLIVPPPPPQNSPTIKAELAQLHQIEQTRTPAQVSAAQADDKEEDIFLFGTVLGPSFRAGDLPLTAALSNHVVQDVEAVDDPLKAAFARPRPYQLDPTLHPVCPTSTQPTSYPSGHSFVGYLEAFVLIQIVPEKRREILDRADDFAHNRLVCGVHYLSDTAASRAGAYAAFGYMLATPRFQMELAAARAETRKRLGLN